MKKIIKKNWIIILLLCLALFLLILKLVTTTDEQKDKQEQAEVEPTTEISENNKISLNLNTNQSQVYCFIDQEIENIQQPIKLPANLNIQKGEYTLQFFKEGYKVKTLSLKLESNQDLDIELEKETISGDFYRIPSETGIQSLGWNENKIYYQVDNKLKEARGNTTLAFFSTSNKISFSQTGKALTYSANKLFLVEKPPKVKEVDLAADQAYFSPDGQKIAVLKNTSVTVYDLEFNQITNFNFDNQIVSLNWPNSNQLGCLTNSKSDKSLIYLLDLNSENKKQIISLDEEIVNLQLSPQTTYLAVDGKTKTTIYNLNGNSVYEFNRKNKNLPTLSIWRTDNQLILIEKTEEEYTQDKYRRLDKIWLINPNSGRKEFVALSAPLRNKIDFAVKPALSPDKNGLIVTEKEGPIWLLLLNGSIQNYMPEYQILPTTIPYSAP
jgi:hypothetical protein